MTFSFWVRGDVPSSISFWLADWPYSGNFAAGNGCSVTTTWQRCTVSGAFPSNANGGFYVPIRSDNQGSPITVYIWGPQLNEGAAGVYVSTAGTARTASGGIATGSISTLAVGTHAMTAAVSADANVNTATSATVMETVTKATPVVTLTCSPTTITYGGTPSTCTSSVTSGATGTNAWSINGPWTTTSTLNTSYQIGIGNPIGTDTVGVAYSGDANYTAASATSVVVAITQAPQTVTFTAPTSPVNYGVSPIELTATATSGLGVTFTVVSGPGSISGSTLTITGAGTVVVAANQAGNSNFLPAVQATQSITVNIAVTSTTLAVLPSATVTAGTVVTLTATVQNPAAVTKGMVLFCNSLATHCGQGTGLYGSASLTASGTATLKMRFGAGANSVKAVFVATSSNAASASSANSITVSTSPVYPSSTTLSKSGSAGNYTLSGTVTGFGTQGLTGSLAFLDTSNSNVQIGSASLNTSTRSFAGPVPYAVGSDPKSNAVGDFNGDGIPDLVVSNYGDNTVSVLLGNGEGTFRPKVTYAAGSWPVSVAVGDFTGNGIQDLVVANNGAGTVSILLGNGNGTFQAPVAYASSGSNPVTAVTADLNGDGILDLAIAGDGAVTVLLGNGNGTFQPAVTYLTASVARSVAVADFNGDGIPDLVVADEMSSEVSVFLGNGDGTFRAPALFAAGAYVWDIKVGDFNGDGIPDVVVANYVDGTASVLIGNGDGTLRPPVAYATGAGLWSLAVADFNGDGIADLVATNSWDGTVSVLLGNGDGTFQTKVTLAAGVAPTGVAVGDFNGDGATDLAVTDDSSNTVLALLGDQSATFNAIGVNIIGSGTHNVFASYPGDGSRTASQSATVPLTATMITPTVTVSCSPTSMTYSPSDLTYCTVSVSGSATGNTSVTYNGASWSSVPLSGGVAVYGGMNGQPAGTYSIVASYAGDSNYTAATGSTTFTVNKAPTVTEISSSANPITHGGSATFTALVDTGGGGASGSVAFTSNGSPIGSGTVSTATTTNLLPYSQNLLGSTWTGYCGPLSNMTQNTPDFMAPDGTATAAKFAVANGICAGPGSNGVLIGGLPSGMTAGQSYTNSVWLRGAVGGETVNFGLNDCAMISVTLTSSWKRYTAIWPTIAPSTATCEGGRGFQILGANETYYMWGAQTEQSATAGPYIATGSVPATGTGGIATLTTTTLAVGSDSIVATYSGDANTLTSTSNPLIETVTPDASVVTLTSSANPANYGASVIFTAQTTAAATGSMTFYNGATILGTGTMAGGVATYTATGLSTGTHSITASYSGDSDYSPAVSTAVSQVIVRASATVSMTSTFSPSTYGQSVTFTFTATGVLGTPGGTVAISDGASLLATPTLNASGVATFTTSNLTVGSHTLTAVYGGDANYK